MTAVASFAILIAPTTSIKVKALGITYVGTSLIVISRSDAQQGFLVFLAGRLVFIRNSIEFVMVNAKTSN
jgi:hypothetical protein